MRPPSVCSWLALTCLAVVAIGCSDPQVTRLVVTPDSLELERGESMTVTATYVTDGVPRAVGTEASWTSDLPSIAAVSGGGGGTGVITGVSNGATVIKLRANGLQTTVRVNVSSPAFTSLSIDPPASTIAAGLSTQLTATARLADGTQQPVNHLVTWSSSSPSVASIDTGGEVTAHQAGGVTITATLGELSAIASVTVGQPRLTAIALTPANPTVPLGGMLPLVATGTYTDGSTRDLTTMVSWSSAQPAVVSVSLIGQVTGLVVGATMISATSGNVRGSTTVTVGPPVLASLAVTPANPSLAIGQSRDLVATGTLTDGSSMDLTAAVTWSSSAPAVATVSNVAGSRGRATAVAVGSATIKATMGMIEGQTNLTVGPAVLVSVVVAPGVVSVPLGRTQQFTATGTMSDGAQVALTATATWTSTATAIATVSDVAGSKGLATTRALGTTTISATSGMVTGSATMVVAGPALEGLTVLPADSSLAVGATRPMRAVGAMSDGSTPDLTALVTWSTSNAARATITAAGVARGVAVGAVTITAQQGMVTGTTGLTVTPAELVSIAVTPPNPTVPAGATQQLTATGTYSDAATMDLTATATWSSSTPAVATVSNVAGSQGRVTTVAGGTATITATVGAISGSTVVTSSAATVSAFSPPEGATAVRPTATVVVTFSQAMNPTSLVTQLADGMCLGAIQLSADGFNTCVAFTAAGPVMSGGDTIATVVPAAPLRALGRYRLRVTTAAQAATGIPMTQDVAQAAGFTVATDGECAAELVVSQVYGGGGNAGAPLLHDFVELHNPGPTAVNLGGKALQFASAAGTTWTVQALPSVAIPPGGYFLVREAAGGGAQPPLANPDFIPASAVAMSATSYKVALTATTAPLTGDCPLAATLDLVGYGTATCHEGPAALPALDNVTAALRAAGGCTDRGLAADFAAGAPAPRNALTAPAVCVCYVNESDLQAEVDYCNLQFPTVVTGAAPLAVPAVYGRVYEAGLTEPPGAAAAVRMAIGFGASGSSPLGWTWIDAAFNVSVGNDDEYQAPITLPTAGEWQFISRATRDGTNWTMCDQDGAGANGGLRFDQFQAGFATVN